MIGLFEQWDETAKLNAKTMGDVRSEQDARALNHWSLDRDQLTAVDLTTCDEWILDSFTDKFPSEVLVKLLQAVGVPSLDNLDLNNSLSSLNLSLLAADDLAVPFFERISSLLLHHAPTRLTAFIRICHHQSQSLGKSNRIVNFLLRAVAALPPLPTQLPAILEPSQRIKVDAMLEVLELAHGPLKTLAILLSCGELLWTHVIAFARRKFSEDAKQQTRLGNSFFYILLRSLIEAKSRDQSKYADVFTLIDPQCSPSELVEFIKAQLLAASVSTSADQSRPSTAVGDRRTQEESRRADQVAYSVLDEEFISRESFDAVVNAHSILQSDDVSILARPGDIPLKVLKTQLLSMIPSVSSSSI